METALEHSVATDETAPTPASDISTFPPPPSADSSRPAKAEQDLGVSGFKHSAELIAIRGAEPLPGARYPGG